MFRLQIVEITESPHILTKDVLSEQTCSLEELRFIEESIRNNGLTLNSTNERYYYAGGHFGIEEADPEEEDLGEDEIEIEFTGIPEEEAEEFLEGEGTILIQEVLYENYYAQENADTLAYVIEVKKVKFVFKGTESGRI